MTFNKLMLIALFMLCSMYVFSQDKPEVSVGGALRFNYHYDSWREDLKEQGGEFIYDVFRVNAKAKYKGIYADVEYRFYSQEFGGNYLKQGWLGYDFSEENKLHLGLTQVPFGIQTYNSNSWFFNIPYYVGLEDDHDIGVKYMHEQDEGLSYQVGFFKNAEYTGFGGGESSFSRYSYDVTSFYNDEYRNKELNTFAGKLEYNTTSDNGGKHKVGTSAKLGKIWNFDTRESGKSNAFEAHYQYSKDEWDFKLQALTYEHDPQAPVGEASNQISMAAYGFPYLVASQANIYTAGVKYSKDVDWGPVSNLSFYNDFGYMDKEEDDFEHTIMNVTGVLVSAGNLYTYIDMAQGVNQSWVGGDYNTSFAAGTQDADWESRFNINFGYYF